MGRAPITFATMGVLAAEGIRSSQEKLDASSTLDLVEN